jgi:hypothetical protein
MLSRLFLWVLAVSLFAMGLVNIANDYVLNTEAKAEHAEVIYLRMWRAHYKKLPDYTELVHVFVFIPSWCQELRRKDWERRERRGPGFRPFPDPTLKYQVFTRPRYARRG